jgi:hypothetical protein
MRDAPPSPLTPISRRRTTRPLHPPRWNCGGTPPSSFSSAVTSIAVSTRSRPSCPRSDCGWRAVREARFLSLLLRRTELLLRGLSFEQRSEREIGEETLTRIDTCWAVATGLAVIDNIRAADFQTRHLLMALKAGEPYRIARSLSIEAVTAAATGGVRNQRRADQLIRSSETIGKTLDNPHTDGLLILARGAAAYFRGQWKLAFELGERGERAMRRHGVGTTWELSSAQNFVVGSLMYLGELHEVRRRLPVLLEDAMDRANLYAEVHLRTRQNLMYLAADDPDGARADIDYAMGRWSHRGYHVQHYLALLARTQIELYAGRAEAAWNLVESGWPELRRSMLLRVPGCPYRSQLLARPMRAGGEKAWGRSIGGVVGGRGRRVGRASCRSDSGGLREHGPAIASRCSRCGLRQGRHGVACRRRPVCGISRDRVGAQGSRES